VAGLTLAAALGLPVVAPTVPAAATDDGEDLSDLLVDEMPGYHLAPLGDPRMGGTGPIDWDEVGADAGPAGGLWPEDMPSYVKSFFRAEDLTSVMLVGFDPKDLPPTAMVSSFVVSLEDEGGQPVTLPAADAAEVDYEAFVVAPPDEPDVMAFSMAAFADDDIVVALYADALRGDTEVQRTALDEFVTAQARYEPPPRKTDDDRIGGDEPAAGDEPTDEGAAPARPAGTTQPAGGDDGPGAQRIVLATLWVLLMAALGLFAWSLARGRPARTVAAGWAPSPPVAPLTHVVPTAHAARLPAQPPAGPPRPPPTTPPLAPVARPPLPRPPVAPPPIPYGGLRTQRGRDRAPAPATTDGEAWRRPG
jgi:hypothetical protein